MTRLFFSTLIIPVIILLSTARQSNVPEKQEVGASLAPVTTSTLLPTTTSTITNPKYTDTPWPKPIYLTPTISFGNQPWRFELIPNGENVGDDQTVGQEWQDSINYQARNLAVPSPFFWEEINLPDQTRFAEVQEYYLKIAQNHGYKLGRSEQGTTRAGQNTYLLTFVKGSGEEASRVILEFWSKTSTYPAFMLILYSNPE